MLEGEIPGQFVKDSGSKLSELAGAYDVLKGKSDEAKAAKDAKDKSNSGKSDEAPGKDRNDDKSSAESSRGQSRP